MAIEFPCNQCGCELRVGDDAAGKKARCPRCGMIHDVPNVAKTGSSESVTEDLTNKEDPYADPRDPWTEQETVYRPADQHTSDRLEITSEGTRWSMKTPDGSIYGPVSHDEMDQWAEEGRVSAECLVQLEGQSHWQSALVLYPRIGGLKVKPDTRSQPNFSHASSTNRLENRTGTERRESRPPRPNSGVTVLVLSVIGLLFLFMPIFSVIAVFMGRSERKAIERGTIDGNNRALLDIGYYIGLTGVTISVCMFLGCCLLIQ